MVVLKRAEKIIKKLFPNKEEKPDLYLYTKKSPCCLANEKDKKTKEVTQFTECIGGCSKDISKWVAENEETFGTLYIAWDLPYDPQSHDRPVDQEYLFGLEMMFNTPSLTVFFADVDKKGVRLCAGSSFKWLQKYMLDCLKQKASVQNKKCNDNDLAKLVNHVTWKCGIRRLDERNSFFRSAAAEPQCWHDEIGSKQMIDNKDKRNFFQTAAENCLDSDRKVQVGLPLTPSDPNKYSNEASDLKDLSGNLCSS